MADSDSLPLQGPPRPVESSRAPGEPPPLPTWSPTVSPAPTPPEQPATRTPWPTVAVPPEPPPVPSAPAAPASATATLANASPITATVAGKQVATDRTRIPIARPAGAPAVAVATKQPAKPEEETLEERAYNAAPSWLISTLVHMVLLIILGLIWAAPKFTQKAVELDAIYADTYGDQLLDDSIHSGTSSPDHADKMMITPEGLAPAEDPFAAPRQPELALDGSSAAAAIYAPTIGLALSGRQEGTRQSLLGAYGGNKITEAGVQAGLAWLSHCQQSDGSWSLKGPYSSGAYNENHEAATAMALLAFLGNGHTSKQGAYKPVVAKGVEYLLRVQGPDGNFYTGNRQEWFYTHAQCTIAICELYALTKDSQYRTAAEKAIQFCVDSQGPDGGWRYRPRMEGDTSVTGWVVMALQSARMGGLEVPQQTLARVGEFLDTVTTDGSLYGYQNDRHPDEVMTAEALLCRQYLGWNQYDPKLVTGVEYVGAHLPNWNDRNVYYWYYGTQVMHHMGGDYWKRWNDALWQMLVDHQEKAGPEKGSWDPKGKSPDAWGIRDQGGRLYVTCLSIYMLEVYYRHLPLYQQGAAGQRH